MSVTIYEIAERAGVSSSTVARVFRGIGLLCIDDAWIFEGMDTQVVNRLVARNSSKHCG